MLEPTCIVDPKANCHSAGTWFMRGGKDRQKNRAKTFPGIARAMAEQWAGMRHSGEPEACPHCGCIEVRDWTQDDGFCPNCGAKMDEEAEP